ncbi:MAG TPA: flagellar hook assembly protein FlgD [Burkholderiaceae bacterium]|nr:flagellar hook assembly protein FlgD [Burkholderiaceae bacterium]
MSTTSSIGGTTSSSSILAALGNSTGATSSTGSTATNPGQALNETFLKLLVAQLNNQDPTNPMDSSQMTAQLAQIDTVSGISNVNTSVQSLVSQFQQFEAMQAAQLAGRSVLVAGNGLQLAAGSTAAGAVSLGSAADAVTVKIADAGGNVVRTLSLGSEAAGMQNFTWDGKTDSGSAAPAGAYTFAVTATAGGNAVSTTSYAAQQVSGVSTDSSGNVQLALANGSQVGFGDVARFL